MDAIHLTNVTLPRSIINSISLNSSTKTERDRLLKIADATLGRAAWQGFGPNQFFDIPYQLFENLVGRDYRKDIEKLKDLKIIDCNESYQNLPNSKGFCKKYRFIEPICLVELETLTLKKSKPRIKANLSEIERKTLETLEKVNIKVGDMALKAETNTKQANQSFKKLLAATISLEMILDRHIKNRIGDKIEDEFVGTTFYFEKNGIGAWELHPVSPLGRKKSKRLGSQVKTLAKEGNYVAIQYKNDFILTPSVNDFLSFKAAEIQTLSYIQLEAIRSKNLYSGRNEVNFRLDTSITNLSSLLDNYLVLDGKGLKHFDLANSQFIILSSLISQILNGKGDLLSLLEKQFTGEKKQFLESLNCLKKVVATMKIKEDFKQFHEAAAKGKVYDNFAECAGLDRDEAKKAFFLIAFGDTHSKGRLIDLFQSTYPSVFAIIQRFKADIGDFKKFPIFLQAVESSIFIDEILNTLFQKKLSPLSKHDSILLKESEAEKGEKIIRKNLNKLLGDYTIKK